MDLSGGPRPEFGIPDMWSPVTPIKNIPTRRQLVLGPSYCQRSQSYEPSWHDPGLQTVIPPWELSLQNGVYATPGLHHCLQDLNASQAVLEASASGATIAGSVNSWPPKPGGNAFAAANNVVQTSNTNNMLPVPPFCGMNANQLLFNGKVFLPKYQSPNTCLPNLNSFPESAMSFTGDGSMPGYLNLMSPEKCNERMLYQPQSLGVTDLANERAREENLLMKEVVAEASLSNVIGNSMYSCFQNPDCAKDLTLMSAEISPHQLTGMEKGLVGGEEYGGIDLNEASKQKPKRKKHRPKVITEGKPARTPKQGTPVLKTPKSAQDKENTTGKRKYTRRKKDATPSLDTNALGEIVDAESRSWTKSVRRSLNFDSESQSQSVDKFSFLMSMFMQNLDSYDQEACDDSNLGSTGLKEAVDSAVAQGPIVENSLAGIVFDLRSLTGEPQNEYLKILQSPMISTTVSQNDEASNNIANSKSVSDAPPKGTKRDSCLTDEAWGLAKKSLIPSFNGEDHFGLNHDAERKISSLQGMNKRIRMESNGSECKSSPKLIYTPTTGWKTIQPSNDFHEFTFAKTMKFLTPEQSQTLKLSKESDVYAQNCHVLSNSMSSLSELMGHNRNSSPLKPSSHKTNCMCQPPTPDKPSGYSNSQESKICGTVMLFETSEDVNKPVKAKGKTRKKREENSLVNPCPPPSSARSSHGQINPGIIETTPRHFHGNNLHPEVISFNQNDKSKPKALTNSNNPSLSSYMNFVDYIVLKLRRLNINKDQVHWQEQNAIVPYAGHGGAIIPYEDTLAMIKRRRPRAKVDLDPETNRVWKLLMGIEQQGNEGASVDKELWWEEERKVFRGRVDSFIARMHLVQGDRRFSQWKGSVVDSVIGVFLTQNVSDHLSSSAFMALAAKFPLQSKGHSKDSNAEKINIPKENQNECIEPLTSTSNLKRNISDHELYSHASLEINTAKKESKKETSCSNQSFGSGTGSSSVVNCGKSLDSHDTELSVGQESPNSGSNTGVTVARSINSVDIEDKRLVEEAISSQNYVVSSQNFNGYRVPSSDQISSNSMLNIETDELLIGITSNGCGHSSFTELLHMAESNKFQELYCNGCMPFAKNQVIHKTRNSLPFMDQMDHLKGACQPYQADFTSHHSLVGLSGILPVSQFLYPPYPSKCVDSEHNASTMKEEIIFSLHSTTSQISGGNKFDVKNGECIGSTADNSAEPDSLTKLLLSSRTANAIESYVPTRSHSEKQPTFLETKVGYNQHSFSQKIIGDRTDVSSNIENSNGCLNIRVEDMAKSQQKDGASTFKADKSHEAIRVETQIANYTNPMKNLASYSKEQNKLDLGQKIGSIQKDEAFNYQKVLSETPKQGEKAKRKRTESEKNMFDWDSLRKDVHRTKPAEERSSSTMDSLDWEAVRSAEVSEIAETIRERGMNNMLAQRIKDFLNRLVLDHGSIDLEWLRDVPPDKSKDYLLSIRGLGLKSAECVRLLTLHHLAFPVDTNVGRICVRLGWVPLQPLPESLQLHLLEMYPMLETIQKYLWPRLCKLDQRTLYELHYQMITFGKVFCTKSKPNCNACPMRGECRHFASAFASARLALPAPEDKSIVCSTDPIASKHEMAPTSSPTSFPQLECSSLSQELSLRKNCEPIIEEPATPEPECPETLESEIEDAFFEDPDEIPVIKLNFEKFTQNLQNYMQENMELQATDMSKALVALNPEAASIPMPKLKNISRLRTEHQVYEIPDSHRLLEGFDQREPDDPCPYLLAIWSPGETAQSTEPPKSCCNSQDIDKLCDSSACYACNSIRESQAHKVRGTLLIPCRTAMRGSFPLNGTYFQVNEVFADHHTSRNPIDIPRDWIWNLSRRTVCFGTSIPTIFRGLTTEGIQQCFWRGFVCVRGFDRVTRAPKPLYARLHFPASKAIKHRKGGVAAKVDE